MRVPELAIFFFVFSILIIRKAYVLDKDWLAVIIMVGMFTNTLTYQVVILQNLLS